jgi:hypothetical protein
MKASLWLTGAAFLWSALAAAYILFGDLYHSSICIATPGGETTCQEMARSFTDVNGSAAALLLAVPLLISGAVGFLLSRRGEGLRALALLPAMFFLLATLVTGFSVGLFYIPAALIVLAAVAVDRRSVEREQQAQAPEG